MENYVTSNSAAVVLRGPWKKLSIGSSRHMMRVWNWLTKRIKLRLTSEHQKERLRLLRYDLGSCDLSHLATFPITSCNYLSREAAYSWPNAIIRSFLTKSLLFASFHGLRTFRTKASMLRPKLVSHLVKMQAEVKTLDDEIKKLEQQVQLAEEGFEQVDERPSLSDIRVRLNCWNKNQWFNFFRAKWQLKICLNDT